MFGSKRAKSNIDLKKYSEQSLKNRKKLIKDPNLKKLGKNSWVLGFKNNLRLFSRVIFKVRHL